MAFARNQSALGCPSTKLEEGREKVSRRRRGRSRK
jgi:hypothetical protein